jgi:hypothetical protein
MAIFDAKELNSVLRERASQNKVNGGVILGLSALFASKKIAPAALDAVLKKCAR